MLGRECSRLPTTPTVRFRAWRHSAEGVPRRGETDRQEPHISQARVNSNPLPGKACFTSPGLPHPVLRSRKTVRWLSKARARQSKAALWGLTEGPAPPQIQPPVGCGRLCGATRRPNACVLRRSSPLAPAPRRWGPPRGGSPTGDSLVGHTPPPSLPLQRGRPPTSQARFARLPQSSH